MNEIEGIDLKQLVEECEVEFEKEKQIIEINKKITVVMTPEEAKEHYDSLLRHTGRRRPMDMEDCINARAADIFEEERKAVAAKLLEQRKYWMPSHA